MISPYLAQQLSGPVSQSVIDSAKAEFDKTQTELDYILSMDIDTVESDLLYLLGLWAGFPWPLAPLGTFEADTFAFGDVADYPLLSIQGFNSGFFTSTTIDSLVMYPKNVYIKMLKAFCKMKANGASLQNVEEFVFSLWEDYTVAFNADKDLVFTFLPNIPGSFLYALEWASPRLSVLPRILFAQG